MPFYCVAIASTELCELVFIFNLNYSSLIMNGILYIRNIWNAREHVLSYVQEKKRLFKEAFPEGQHAYRLFFEATTDMLLNNGAHECMRMFQYTGNKQEDYFKYIEVIGY